MTSIRGERRKVTLLNGEESDTWSPEWAAECLARDRHVQACLRMIGRGSRARREAYCVSVGIMEGAEQEKRVREAVGRLWGLREKDVEHG